MKGRELVGRYQQFDRSRLAGRAANQSEAFELNDHLVNAGGRDAEEALELGLGWRLAVEQDVGVDEGQVLALLVGESVSGRRSGHGIDGLI